MARERNRVGRDHRVGEIATDQHGLISSSQLIDVGLSLQAVSHRTTVGRYHRIHRGVYAVGHRSIGDHGRLLAAILACGEGATISHGTAAAPLGIWDRFPAVVDVIVPCQAGRRIEGIRARRCRYPTAREVMAVDGIPSTTPARTLVDLAGSVGRASLKRAIEAAALHKLLDLSDLDLALKSGSGRRGVGGLRTIIEEWRPAIGDPPDIRSRFEARVLPILLAHGLGRPECNRRIKVGEHYFRPDFLWAKERLIIETDGEATHGTPVAFRRDRRRDQILIAGGYTVARVTWSDITKDLDGTAGRIGRMLLERGSQNSTRIIKEPRG